MGFFLSVMIGFKRFQRFVKDVHLLLFFEFDLIFLIEIFESENKIDSVPKAWNRGGKRREDDLAWARMCITRCICLTLRQ